jgi:sugar phosphate isomerase/epimerase
MTRSRRIRQVEASSARTDRRTFLGTLAGGAAAFALMDGVFAEADSQADSPAGSVRTTGKEGNMDKHVLGAQLYTVREYTKTINDFRETVKKVAKIGYKGIQISGGGPMDPKEVAQAVRDAGLTVGATHVDWGRCLKAIDGVIEEHKLYPCEHTALGGLPREYYTADGLKKFLDELPPVAEKLAAAGIDLSYHNHAHEFARVKGTRKPWLGLLYEQADPKQLKAELDTHWIQRGGADSAEWIRKCAGREPLLHLKDMTVTPDGQPRFAEIGEGNMNWPAILEAAKAGGVRWYLVEQDDCYGRNPFESLAISFRNLQAMGLS